jgi:hypothetical protein
MRTARRDFESIEFLDISMKVKIQLGNEYDLELRNALAEVMKSLGAVTKSHQWGVAGSQECESWTFEFQGTDIQVESETYIGLSIEGEKDIVDRLSKAIGTRKAVLTGRAPPLR